MTSIVIFIEVLRYSWGLNEEDNCVVFIFEPRIRVYIYHDRTFPISVLSSLFHPNDPFQAHNGYFDPPQSPIFVSSDTETYSPASSVRESTTTRRRSASGSRRTYAPTPPPPVHTPSPPYDPYDPYSVPPPVNYSSMLFDPSHPLYIPPPEGLEDIPEEVGSNFVSKAQNQMQGSHTFEHGEPSGYGRYTNGEPSSYGHFGWPF